MKFCNLDITIESYKDSYRHGPDWIQRMANDYGYINDTTASDGSELDCFLGDNEDSKKVYIIDQNKPDGSFDEHKIMLGFSNIADAKDSYFANYPARWEQFRNINEIDLKDFWTWYEEVGTPKKKNSSEEIFIRGLKKREEANPSRYISEENFPRKEGYIVVFKPYGSQGRGYYYIRGKNSWNRLLPKHAKYGMIV